MSYTDYIVNQQQDNYKKSLSILQLCHSLTFNDFYELKNTTTKDVAKRYGKKSFQHIHKKAINFCLNNSGDVFDFLEYSNLSLEAIALLGCTDAKKQSPYEHLLLKIFEPFGFSKKHSGYIDDNGNWCQSKVGIIKKLDAAHFTRKSAVYHKQLNSVGGGQDSDSNEIEELLRRVNKSKIFLFIVCTGDYFSDRKLKEIQNLIDIICPNYSILFTNHTDSDFSLLKDYLNNGFNI